MSWSLDVASAADIDDLMTWFPDAHSVDIWGGPRFRYPFDRESFHEDCRWHEYTSYCLRDPGAHFRAFGQMGLRYQRSHLARLVVRPDSRGQGIGRRLLEMMINAARELQDCDEVALFVYKHNEPAYQCYLKMGFTVQAYPDDAPMADKCFYLARPVD